MNKKVLLPLLLIFSPAILVLAFLIVILAIFLGLFVLILFIYLLLWFILTSIAYIICFCGLVVGKNGDLKNDPLMDSMLIYIIFSAIVYAVYNLYCSLRYPSSMLFSSLYSNIIIYLFVFGLSFVLTEFFITLDFNLLRKLSVKLSKGFKDGTRYSIYVIECLLACFTIVYSEIIQSFTLHTAIIGTMSVLIPIIIMTICLVGTYIYVKFKQKNRKVIKNKVNKKLKSMKAGADLDDNSGADIIKVLQDNSTKPERLYIETCTKEELMMLEIFDSERANFVINERENGNTWYDIDSFVQYFNLQPHEMVEIIDIIVFPTKKVNKNRRLDI